MDFQLQGIVLTDKPKKRNESHDSGLGIVKQKEYEKSLDQVLNKNAKEKRKLNHSFERNIQTHELKAPDKYNYIFQSTPSASFQLSQRESNSGQISLIGQQSASSRRNSRDFINPLQTETGNIHGGIMLSHPIDDISQKLFDTNEQLVINSQKKLSENNTVNQIPLSGQESQRISQQKGSNLFLQQNEGKQQKSEIINSEHPNLQKKNVAENPSISLIPFSLKKNATFSLMEGQKQGNSTLTTNFQTGLDASEHLWSLSQGTQSIKEEKRKVILVQVAGLIVEGFSVLRRGIIADNLIFVIFGVISMALQVMSLVFFMSYLDKLPEQLNKIHTRRIVLFCFSQIIRTAVFLNNVLFQLSDSKYPDSPVLVSSVETLVEAYFIQQLSELVFRNFSAFNLTSKLELVHMTLFTIASFLLLEFKSDTYIIIILQSISILVFVFIRLFILKEFPFSIGKIYNARVKRLTKIRNAYHKAISQMMISTTNQVISPAKIVKSGSYSPLPYSQSIKKNANQEENEKKYIMRRLLGQTTVSVLLDEAIQPICFSGGMKNLLNQFKDNRNKFFHNNQETQQQPEKLFDKDLEFILEKINVERLDSDSMSCWESLPLKFQQLLPFQSPNSNQTNFPIPCISEINSAALLSNRLTKLIPPDSQAQLQAQLNMPQQQQNALQHVAQNNPLLMSQLNKIFKQTPSLINYKDIIYARNSTLFHSKPTFTALTHNNIGFSSKIGLKSKYMMVSLKEVLLKIAENKEIFMGFDEHKPIVVVSFSAEEGSGIQPLLEKFQIKIYPHWNENCNSFSSSSSSQSSKVFHSLQQALSNKEKNSPKKELSFLIVFEEVRVRERIVGKTQFYKLLKSIFRCFNNDLTRSLSNILGTSQDGVTSKEVPNNMKEKYFRPTLLSCKLIKYILHNLRDFNDIVGERFQLRVDDTSIPKVAEDSVMLFKATSDKNISFRVVINDEVPIIIQTDQRRLVQIIITLLSNAHKHTTGGSLTFRIFHPKVGNLFVRQYLRFQVEDTGEGMEDSIQSRLSHLFNSGINYQDFKTISTFGFNLFISNILAKKLFPATQNINNAKDNNNREDLNSLTCNEEDSNASGIKFSSSPGSGSIFYFDILLFDEKKQEKVQDSLMQFISVKEQLSPQQKPVFPTFKSHPLYHLQENIFITNSVPTLNNEAHLSDSEKMRFVKEEHKNKSEETTKKIEQHTTEQYQAGSMEIPEEESEETLEKNDTRMMLFNSQPRSIISEKQNLYCECWNLLLIDRVSTNLEGLSMAFQQFHFRIQTSRNLDDALRIVTQRSNYKCPFCGYKQFVFIVICVDGFFQHDLLLTFPKKLEAFTNNSLCQNSIIIVISSSDAAIKKLNENQRINDFLSGTFDNIELHNLLIKWKFLPVSESSQISRTQSQQVSLVHISADSRTQQ